MRIHHIEVWVKNRKRVLDSFCKMGFYSTAWRKTSSCEQTVLTNGRVNFLFTGPTEDGDQTFMAPLEVVHKANNAADTVYNLCLEVDDVEVMTRTMCHHGGKCLRGPEVVTDHDGPVNYSIVGTGFGNIIHTLVSKTHYNGRFLPGFQSVSSPPPQPNRNPTGHVDHVTYVCHPGQSDIIIDWYSKCFGMENAPFYSDGHVSDEMVIKENIDIRLKAAKLAVKNAQETLHLVVAEPLTTNSQNHVQVFLEEHGGPGIEHVALHTDNMLTTMGQLHLQKAVGFRPVPATYYNSVQLDDRLSFQVDQLRSLGILIDAETVQCSTEMRYLLQVFTTHILAEKTFFLEIIQRLGAKGFGARNIINIMRAIEKDMGMTSQQRNDLNKVPANDHNGH